MEIKQINSTELHLVADLFDKYRVFYKQPPDIILARNFIRERLINNQSIIFVALEQLDDTQLPVGFTQLYPMYSSVRAIKNWILNDLYVDLAHRRKGIAEKLILTAMQFAKEDNAKFVQLETAIDNNSAQSLYESMGFIKQPAGNDFFVYRIDFM